MLWSIKCRSLQDCKVMPQWRKTSHWCSILFTYFTLRNTIWHFENLWWQKKQKCVFYNFFKSRARKNFANPFWVFGLLNQWVYLTLNQQVRSLFRAWNQKSTKFKTFPSKWTNLSKSRQGKAKQVSGPQCQILVQLCYTEKFTLITSKLS